MAVLVCGIILLLSIALPYALGQWLGAQLAGHSGSVLGEFLGWLLEGLWLTLLGGAALDFLVTRSRRRQRADQAGLRQVREAKRFDLEGHQNHLSLLLSELHDVRHCVESLPSDTAADPAMRLIGMSGVELLEPRVEHRGGPRVPTPVDRGDVTITVASVVFRGAVKNVEWATRHLTEVMRGDGHLSLPMSNRKTVTGFTVDHDALPVMELAIEAARRLTLGTLRIAEFRVAADRVEEWLQESVRRVEFELVSLR